MRRILAILKDGLIVALIAYATMLFATQPSGDHELPQPSCPEEDSCRADYFDGEWHIVEVTP